ncbi:MAG TPA: hypothetical protein DCZ48_05130 [Methylococcaceae bacterium]|nr:hypothetical protein [Methylococcaceae bacterium]
MQQKSALPPTPVGRATASSSEPVLFFIKRQMHHRMSAKLALMTAAPVAARRLIPSAPAYYQGVWTTPWAAL